MTITTSNFIKHLEPGLKSIVWDEYYMNPEVYSQIMKVETSDKAFEKLLTTSGFGLFVQKAAGTSITYDTAQEAYYLEVVHAAYALGFRITHEMYQDDLYRNMQKLPQKLGISAKETVEIIAHGLFNNGFSSSYLFGDGVELFSTLHPLIAGGYGVNTLAQATDLSVTSLKDALVQFETATVNNRGLLQRFRADKLIVPPALQWTATEILRSEKQSGNANNDINVFNSLGIQLVIDPYLTDADTWFLQDSRQQGATFFWREMLEMDTDTDFDTGDGKFKAYMRFSRTTEDWRGNFGVQGA